MRLVKLLIFNFLISVVSVFAFAQTEPPQFVTVDGRLYDSVNPTDPLLDANVAMRIQVLNPAKTCILYEEQQSVSTLANGYFNARVGSPTAGMDSLKRSSLDSGNAMSLVFQNQNLPIAGQTSGGLGCSYTPAPGESRYFRFIVTPSTTGVTSTLSPDMTIDSVPQSLVAETLQGFASDDFLQINANVTQAKANSLFGGSYAALTSLLSGTSTLYLQNTANGTVIPSRPSDPVAPSAGQIWYDSVTNELKYYDGTAVQTVGSGLDATKLPLAGGTMAGAIIMGSNDITSVGHITQSAQRTFRFGGFTAAQETTLLTTPPMVLGQQGTTWYNTDTDKVMYWDGVAAQELLTSTSANGLVPHCNTNESLEMSPGPTYVWSCVATTDSTKLALTGGALTGALTMNAQNQVRYADSDSSNYAAIQSPAAIGANYVLTLPIDDGTPGQVLQTDGNGILSWLTIPTAPVTSVFGRTGVVVAATSDYDANQIDNTPAGTISATDVQAALNELDTEKAITTRNINTGANSGLAGGGDLSADRNLAVDITGTAAEATVAGADEILIWDVSAGALRKMTRTNFVLSEAEVDAMVSNNGYLSSEADTLSAVTGRGANTATNIVMDTQAQVRFSDSAGGEYSAIQAPATIGANYVLTLPVDNGGVGEVLSTDGNGVLSWIAIPSAPVTTVFGRNGAVVAVAGDYDANQIDNTPAGNIAATDVQAALNELDTEKAITARNINTGANSGLAGGGDLSADRNLRVDIAGTTALGVAADNADEVLIYDASGTALRKVTRAQLNLSEAEVDAMVANNGYAADADKVNRTGDTMTGALNLDNEQELRLSEADGSGANYVAIKSPTTLGANYTLTLPVDDGTNGQVLSTDGNGLLSWVSSVAPAADSLDFTHFADAMSLDASTDISASGTQVLSITNSGTGNSFRVNDQAADGSPFVIDSNGSVGIGTTAPNAPLDVGGYGAPQLAVNPSALFTSNADAISGIEMKNTHAGTSAEYRFSIFNNNNTNSISFTQPSSANTGILFGLTRGTASFIFNNGTAGRDLVIGPFTSNSLVFGTNNLERARVSSTGSFGIGTTVPGTLLDVAGAITSRPYGTNTGETGQIIMRELAAGGSETATIRAPDALGASYALTLPVDDGTSGQVLSTDGNGVLSWIAAGSGITADSLNFTDLADALVLDASTDISATGTNVLSITNSGTGNSFVVNDEAGDASPFIIDSQGYVGMGIVPTSELHVRSTRTTGLEPFVTVQAGKATANGSSMAFIRNSSTQQALISFESTTLGNAEGFIGALPNKGDAIFMLSNNGGGANPALGIDVFRGFVVGESSSIATTHAASISPTGAGYFASTVGIGTTTPGTMLDVAGAITSRPSGTLTGETGQLIMQELAAGGTETATIRAPDALAASYALTLPVDDGTNGQVLSTDGNGILSWIAAGVPAADSINFTELADALVLDASTDISATGTNVFSITNTGTANSFVVNDQTSDTTPFVINAAGSVGIGTATPGASLDIDGTQRITKPYYSHGLTIDLGATVSTGRAPLAVVQSVAGNGMNNILITRGTAHDSGAGIAFGTTGVGLSGATPGWVTSISPKPGVGPAYDYSIAEVTSGVLAEGNGHTMAQRLVILPGGNTGIGTNVPVTLLDVAGAITSRPSGTGTGQTGQLIMRELAAGGAETATIRAPDALAASYALTLPVDDGTAGQVLSTDGNGILSWIAPGTTITADSLNFTDLADALVLDASTDISATGTNALSITNSGTGSSFRVNDDAGDTTPFIIDDTGKVGIGTTAPAQALSVVGRVSAAPTGVTPDDTYHGNLVVTKPAASGQYINLIRSSSYAWSLGMNYNTTTFAIGQGAATDSNFNNPYFSIDPVAALTTVRGGFRSYVNATGDVQISHAGMVSTMQAAPAVQLALGSNGAEVVRLDSSGNVGIGTTIPGAALDVQRATTTLAQFGTADGDGSGARIWQSLDDGMLSLRDSFGAEDVRFASHGGTGQDSWLNAGRLGIGTTAPGTLLDVAGAITSRPFGAATGETGQFVMRELGVNGTNTATIRAPDALASNYSLTLPIDDGTSGQVLQTDGNGLLSWVSGGSLIADDSLDFDKLADSMALDASTDIAVDNAEVFSITNTGTGDSFRVNDQAADTTPFLIDTAGNVGIGTTAPGFALDVNGTVNIPENSLLRLGHQYHFISRSGTGNNYHSSAFHNFTGTSGNILRLGVGTLEAEFYGGVSIGSGYVTSVAPTNGLMVQGNVGIGTTTPTSAVHAVGNVYATGQISTGSQTITGGGSSSIDWNNGNAISTDYNCSSNLSFVNLRNGGTYTLVITDTGTTQCNFSTTTTGLDAGTVSYRFNPANATRSPTSHTIYTLMRVGSVVYVSWQSGF